MKKFINIALITLAGLLALSCADEKDMVVFDSSKVVNQVLNPVSGIALAESGDAIEMTFDEANFGLQAPSGYELYVAAPGTDFDPCQKVNATIEDGKITFSQKDINTALLNLGAAADSEFGAEFRLKGYLKNDKGAAIESSTVWSNTVSAAFTPYNATLLDVDVYEHVWIIGASSTVGAWAHDKVYQYLYDYTKSGDTYSGVISFDDGSKGASDGWKITGTAGWVDDLNWGSEAQAESSEQTEIQLVSGGGSKDIKCLSKKFYSLKFNSSSLVLNVLAGWDKISIVGDFQGWKPADDACVMNYNDSYHRFYIDYTFDTDSKLKFTADGNWDLNWGVDCVNGGKDIDVAAGSYRVYLDLNKNEYSFSAGMFGKDEPVAGAGEDTPDEPAEPYKGWGIIGLGGDWDNDVAMTEKDGVWTGYATVAEGDTFKLRKDAAWEEDYGGTFVSVGTAFTAVPAGANISAPAGFYQVVFDSNNLTITLNEGDVWSLIGNFNEWSGDVDMVKTEDGLWVAEEVELTDGWKIRHNHAWSEDRGGVFEELGKAFEAVSAGSNIECGEGKFKVTYDPENETITVEDAVKVWSVIGNFNGWGADANMTEVAPGIWISETLELTAGWKVRFGADWAVNYGGATPSAQGEFVQAVPGGSDINLAGTYKVVLNTNNGTIGTLGFGLVGTISSLGFSWNEDLPMNLGKDGKWYSIPTYFKAEDTFKIRWEGAWNIDFGGECESAETAFEAVAGGKNMQVPAAGTYMVVYDPEAKTLNFTKNFWGVIGDFNSWGGDVFMMYDGDGNWAAYNQEISGGWKIRQSAAWDNDRGGTFAEAGAAFEAAPGGSNINCGDLAKFNVVYNATDETITVSE